MGKLRKCVTIAVLISSVLVLSSCNKESKTAGLNPKALIEAPLDDTEPSDVDNKTVSNPDVGIESKPLDLDLDSVQSELDAIDFGIDSNEPIEQTPTDLDLEGSQNNELEQGNINLGTPAEQIGTNEQEPTTTPEASPQPNVEAERVPSEIVPSDKLPQTSDKSNHILSIGLLMVALSTLLISRRLTMNKW